MYAGWYFKNRTFIKSEINYKRSLSFIWYHLSDPNYMHFTTFNITTHKMEDETVLIGDCSSEKYKTKINKINKNKEITFANENIDKKIRVELYNNIDNYKYNKTFSNFNASCENINGLAISYYNNNNYYIIVLIIVLTNRLKMIHIV